MINYDFAKEQEMVKGVKEMQLVVDNKDLVIERLKNDKEIIKIDFISKINGITKEKIITDKKIESLQIKKKEKDDEIADLKNKIWEAENEFNKRVHVYIKPVQEQKEQLICELAAEKKSVENIKFQINSKNIEIADMSRNYKNQLTQMNTELNKRSLDIENLNKTINTKETEIINNHPMKNKDVKNAMKQLQFEYTTVIKNLKMDLKEKNSDYKILTERLALAESVIYTKDQDMNLIAKKQDEIKQDFLNSLHKHNTDNNRMIKDKDQELNKLNMDLMRKDKRITDLETMLNQNLSERKRENPRF